MQTKQDQSAHGQHLWFIPARQKSCKFLLQRACSWLIFALRFLYSGFGALKPQGSRQMAERAQPLPAEAVFRVIQMLDVVKFTTEARRAPTRRQVENLRYGRLKVCGTF